MYTGNTDNKALRLDIQPVYPCVYREHNISALILYNQLGLSLCIQGTPKKPSNRFHILRFIPVYTGNTEITITGAFLNAVYPCVYREHLVFTFCCCCCCGLSLCIQGTPLLICAVANVCRFIPVYTGNTSIISCTVNKIAVYPCVYREHVHCPNVNNCVNGLSLCIQGTL